MKNMFLITALASIILSCAQSQSENNTEVSEKDKITYQTPEGLDTLQTAYFASGCFWCAEGVFESVKGVVEAESGYAGGEEKDPTYEEVSSGSTGHAETVKVYYDSTVVSFGDLVDVFFNSHDPTTLNQQGPDKGTQYRSIAFFQNDREKEIIEEKILTLLTEKVYTTITTEVTKLDTFYLAEAYHQNYIQQHISQPYVENVSLPRIKKFKEKMPGILKK